MFVPILARRVPLNAETAPSALGGLAAVFLWWWLCLLVLSLRAGHQGVSQWHRLALYLLPPLALLAALAAYHLAS